MLRSITSSPARILGLPALAYRAARLLTAGLIAVLLVGCAAQAPAGTPVETVIWKDAIGAIASLSVHPAGRYVASGGSNGTVHIWDAQIGQIVTVINNGAEITALSYSPDGSRVAVGSVDGFVRIWDARTAAFIQYVQVATRVSALAWNSDGTRMLIGSADSKVALVDLQRKGQLIRAFPGHSAAVTDLGWVPTTRNFVSTGLDNKFIYWDSLTGAILSTLLVPGPALSVGIAFDARGMAIGTEGGGVQMFSLSLPTKAGKAFAAGSPIRHVAYSPDAARIAAASEDQIVRVFDSATGLQVAALVGHTTPILALAWLDKDRVMSADADSTIRIWTVGGLPVPTGPPTPTRGAP